MSGSCVPRCSSSTPSSHSRPNDERIHLWVGSGLRSFDSKGCVVERSVFSPYKLSRAGDCFPHLDKIPEVAVWRSRPDSDRQHYDDALSQQGGRDQVQVIGLEGQKIIHWCLSMRITLSPVDISGQENVEVDCLSWQIENPRRLERCTGWSLDLRVTNLLFVIWGQPTVDLFATRLNNKVEALFSPHPPQTLWPCRAFQTGPRVCCTCIPQCPSCPLLFAR